MFWLLFFILLIAGPLFASLIYKHNGKRQIFNIDLIQFIYGFILAPISFLWLKTFLFSVMKNELGLSLSINQLFFLDTLFSIILMYLLMAVAIHSVTKTFWLKRNQDPLYDVFHLSEYFHLWFTHIVIFGGSLILMTIFSIVNMIVPIEISLPNRVVFIGLIGGALFGIGWFFGVWLSDPEQERKNFIRVMRLFSAVFFLVHISIYFFLEPKFSFAYIIYWFMLAASFAIIVAFMIFHRFKRIRKIRDGLLHRGWGENIQLEKGNYE